MNVFARPPLSPLRRARLAALAVCLFVALPFSTLPLIGGATVERTADDASDTESDSIDEARPTRTARAVLPPVVLVRPPLVSTLPVCHSAPPPLGSAATRGLYPLRC